MDINRNVGVRDICNDDNGPSPCQPFAKLFQYKSLPNIAFAEYELKMSPKIRETETTFYYRASSEPNNNYISNPCILTDKVNDVNEATNDQQEEDEQHAISGRLEIRVLSKDKISKEASPNPEESIYFDAVVTNGPQNNPTSDDAADDTKVKDDEKQKAIVQYEEEFIWINKEPPEKKYDIKVYEDSLKIQKYKIVTVDKSDDALDGPDEDEKEDDGREKDVGDIEVKEAESDNKNEECGQAAGTSSIAAINLQNEREDLESTTDNRIDNERLRDCSNSSNSKIPVFNPSGSARMLSQRSSWAGVEEGPDISDLTPGDK
jgi:hypothetical protein